MAVSCVYRINKQRDTRGKGTLLTAATKHSAVKSKAAKPLAVLQCIAESIESTPEHGTEDACSAGTLG